MCSSESIVALVLALVQHRGGHIVKQRHRHGVVGLEVRVQLDQDGAIDDQLVVAGEDAGVKTLLARIVPDGRVGYRAARAPARLAPVRLLLEGALLAPLPVDEDQTAIVVKPEGVDGASDACLVVSNDGRSNLYTGLG